MFVRPLYHVKRANFSYMANAHPNLMANAHPNKKTIVESAAEKLENNCKDGLIASSIIKKQIKRSPKAPFTTSSMIQEASRKLGFPPKLTMTLAGKLFRHGHITYHRTDSVGIVTRQAP